MLTAEVPTANNNGLGPFANTPAASTNAPAETSKSEISPNTTPSDVLWSVLSLTIHAEPLLR